MGTDLIKNQIAEALVRRIDEAIQAKKVYEETNNESLDDGTFRVILVIPNFPEGAVSDVSVQVSVYILPSHRAGQRLPTGGPPLHADDSERYRCS